MYSQILYAYFKLLLNLAELLGAKRGVELMFDILSVIKFEIDLAAVRPDRVIIQLYLLSYIQDLQDIIIIIILIYC
jgi:hypothetical protein